MSGHGIHWSDYFDKIFCLHYAGYSDRVPGLVDDLKRVGIYDSGIFEWRYTTNDPFERYIESANRRLATLAEQNRAYVSILVNYARILRETKELGYRRVLVLEDDVRFLKDLGEIQKLLDAMPKDAGVVQFDKHLAEDDYWQRTTFAKWAETHVDKTGLYIRPDGRRFGSSACVAYTASGAADVLSYMESTFNCPDSSFRACPSYVASLRSLAIQVMYQNGAIHALYGGNKHTATYKDQGLDYADYNVPLGYSMEASNLVEPSGKTCLVWYVDGDEKFWRRTAYSMHVAAEHVGKAVDLACVHGGDVPENSLSVQFIQRLTGPDRFISAKADKDWAAGTHRWAPNDPFGPIVMARVRLPAVPELRQYSRLISLDSDVLLGDRWQVLVDDLVFGLKMAVDTGLPTWGARRNTWPNDAWWKLPEAWDCGKIDPGARFYNAGIVVFDRDYLPKDYLNRVMSAAESAGASPHQAALADEDILNYCFASEIIELPAELVVERNSDLVASVPVPESFAMIHVNKNDAAYTSNVAALARDLALDYGRRKGAMKKGRFFISVYAITKNEAKFVDRWMDSMQEADEVVVLDTGSTDDTVEKLRARGAKVEIREFKPWRFDTPRNASMELCSPMADILVCTDLDEVLNKGWRDALEKAWLSALEDGRTPTTASYWYTWSFTPDGKPDRRFIYEKVHRPGICKWTHPVHEILSYDGPKDVVFVKGMELEHHPDKAKSRASYLPLLEMSVEEDPEDDRNMHYLGREYMFRGMWQKAVDTLQRHLNLPRAKWRAERAASMRFMGRCYAAMGKDLTAELWYRRACDEEPDARESAVEYAQFLYDHKAPWTQLRAACERALRVTERAGSYLTEAEAWGSRPYDLLSVALWNLGKFKEALIAAEKALELEPGDERIKKNVENMRKAAAGC